MTKIYDISIFNAIFNTEYYLYDLTCYIRSDIIITNIAH